MEERKSGVPTPMLDKLYMDCLTIIPGNRTWGDTTVYWYFTYLCEILKKCGHCLLPSLLQHMNATNLYFHVWLQDSRKAFVCPPPWMDRQSDLEIHTRFVIFSLITSTNNFKYIFLESLHTPGWINYSGGKWMGPTHYIKDTTTTFFRTGPVYKYCFLVRENSFNDKVIYLLTKGSKYDVVWKVKAKWITMDWNGYMGSMCLADCPASPDRQMPSLRNMAIRTIVEKKIDTAPLPKIMQKEIEEIRVKWDFECYDIERHYFF